MKFTQAIKMAFSSILSNKMRSFLTMLGVIIGIAAVIILVGVGRGTTKQISDQIQGLGTNLITVNITGSRDLQFTNKELSEIKSIKSISEIAPSISGSATVKAGDKNISTSLQATSPEFEDIRNMHVQAGRFIVQTDVDSRFKVAVIGVDIADQLFNYNRNVIGNTISVNGTDFKIVGLLASQGSSMTGSNDDQIIIPYTTAQRLLKNKEVRTFYISAASHDVVQNAIDNINIILLRKFKSTDYFKVFSQTDLLSTMSQTTATLTMMLGGIAGISLLVGGIGIMNIMLVSVTERTREIGIRKAIGAKRKNILVQFLIESIMLSGMGGIIGIIVGYLGAAILTQLLKMTISVSFDVILLATTFAVSVGIIFGLYPANKASKLRPIEALRYE